MRNMVYSACFLFVIRGSQQTSQVSHVLKSQCSALSLVSFRVFILLEKIRFTRDLPSGKLT